MNHALSHLLPINYPIIQAGMVWVSGAKLAAASTNAGILGTIGAGSMKPEILEMHLKKAFELSNKPEALAVNVPLLYEKTKQQIELALDFGIKIFITSAGSPKIYTPFLKNKNCVVIHVISNPELAKKCEEAGCDAVIAEGFEAGGHNGRDEITTMALVPQVVDAVKIPVIAAGGIADGRGIAAALSLGAKGVQLGTRFVATRESSAHPNFKQALLQAKSNSTMLLMKKHIPVRLLRNHFFDQIKELEERGASKEELAQLLGHGRARKGMLEGDLNEGELEIGQVCSLLKDLPSVEELVERLVHETHRSIKSLSF